MIMEKLLLKVNAVFCLLVGATVAAVLPHWWA